jgi:hypothetical protein
MRKYDERVAEFERLDELRKSGFLSEEQSMRHQELAKEIKHLPLQYEALVRGRNYI